MPNRNLSEDELKQLFQPLIEQVRTNLDQLSSGDSDLLWALRRKLAKELTYDEKGKPQHRKNLKQFKRCQQSGKCAICGNLLPGKYSVLDRLEAMKGYNEENTRLICQDCDTKQQQERKYS
jgi:hypothetical protein